MKLIRSILFTLNAVMLVSTASPVAADDNWPNWRGPRLAGSTTAKNLPTEWSEEKNIRWKTPLPAWAGSSPIIWQDRIFLTSPAAEGEDKENGDKEEGIGRRLRRATIGGPGGDRILLMCFDKRDGTLLWQQAIDEGNKLYGKQNMASPSPVTDGSHVWAMTGTGRLICYDMDGKKRWQRDLQKDYGRFGLYWGYASSPLLYQDRLIVEVLHGAETKDPSYVVAFNKLTGATLWKVERPTTATRESPDAYTTPTVATLKSGNLVIISGADCVTAHDPESGKEVWRAYGLNPGNEGNYRICGSPVYVFGLVVASSREKPVIALRAGGRGDVTTSHLAWKYDDKKAPDVPSIAGDGERLYLLHDDGFITCLAASDGRVLWGPERITGGPYSASPLVGDGKVYVTNEDCVTTVLRAGGEFNVLSKNKLDGGYCLSSFAVSDGALFMRTQKYLYCISGDVK